MPNYKDFDLDIQNLENDKDTVPEYGKIKTNTITSPGNSCAFVACYSVPGKECMENN